MCRVIRPTALLIAIAAVLTGCTYLPHAVFSNWTAGPARLEIRFSPLGDTEECPEPKLLLMPASHAKRQWRNQETRTAPRQSYKFDSVECTLVASIPPRTALDIKISRYFGWTSEPGHEFDCLKQISLSGEYGSIEVSGRAAFGQFETAGIGNYVWEYGRG